MSRSQFQCNSNAHTAHVDVATNASALHNGYLASNVGNSKLVFVKKTVKTNIFSLAPQSHVTQGATPAFGGKASWKIGRQGDYLLNNWIRAEISGVTAANALPNGLFLRWTHNVGHNIFRDIELAFSTVPAAQFDEFYLDFFSAFSVPASKRNVYDNMIGNLPELVNPIVDVLAAGTVQVLPSFILNVPLPLPYSRDNGIALPTGALIYNEVTLNVTMRPWTELMVASNPTDGVVDGVAPGYSRQIQTSDVVAPPTIVRMDAWGTYAIVASEERRRMGKVPRDMIWEVIQTASNVSIQTPTVTAVGYLRYTYAVKALFFGMRNTSVPGQLSNYTSRQALCYVVPSKGVDATNATVDMELSSTEFPAPNAFDPIDGMTLKYEGSDRVCMNADYFSMIQPYFFGDSVPAVTGYHVFSYSVNFVDSSHGGSTDYGKLTNVSMEVHLGADAQAALTGTALTVLPFVNELGVASALPAGYLTMASVAGGANHLNGARSGAGTAINQASGFNAQKQTYELKNACLAHNVLRVIGGGVGFPIF